MPDPRPIGFFDSGVGGLSVLREARLLLPHEDFIYYADSAYCPYGIRTPAEIVDRAIKICDFLVQQGCKALVVACNTASVTGLEIYRKKYTVPIIGMEPAVKPAANVSKNGKIGILATSVTLSGDRFSSLLQRYQNGSDVYSQPCPGLVEIVEAGNHNTAEAAELLKNYLKPLLDNGVDTIVLGCTHYPFLKSTVKTIVGSDVVVIDTGEAVAKQIQRVLKSNNAEKNTAETGKETFYTSGNIKKVSNVIKKLWGGDPVVDFIPL